MIIDTIKITFVAHYNYTYFDKSSSSSSISFMQPFGGHDAECNVVKLICTRTSLPFARLAYCNSCEAVRWILFLHQDRGRSLTKLTRRGRLFVLKMSMVCRFSLITVKEFLQQCQIGMGTWSIMIKFGQHS